MIPWQDDLHRWLRTPWVPPAAVVAVGGLDAALQTRDWSVPVMGMLDDSAHVATAGVILAALLPQHAARLAPWALAGSVLIDLDHVPLYAWGALSTGPDRRPGTHSLITVAALGLAAAAIPRLRTPLSGLALGVLLHFVRDIGTGPGLPVLWPAARKSFRVRYASYSLPLSAMAAVTAIRRRRGSPG